jgi:hypothetical protein
VRLRPAWASDEIIGAYRNSTGPGSHLAMSYGTDDCELTRHCGYAPVGRRT